MSYARLDAQCFDYLIPDELHLVVGSLVEIPFGRKVSLGVVRKLHSRPAVNKSRIKPISRLVLPTPLPDPLLELADWLKTYYACSSHAVWSTLLPSGLQAKPRLVPSEQTPSEVSAPTITLSPEQLKATESIWQSGTPSLLEGVTGSGKTHIYEALIRRTLDAGQSVIFLSPEIFLSNQLQERLTQYFSPVLTATDSHLTAAARRNIWLATLNSTEPRLYMGPRSALFLPIRNLGLIIIDEIHDASYKQEQAPRYNARDVAAELAQLHSARLVMGSATPDLFLHWLATQKRIQRVVLDERYGQAMLPSVSLVDMHAVKGVVSPELKQAIRDRLQAGEQTLLLHNRRGTARRLSCGDCGNHLRCPNCDVALVFHGDTGRLHCHLCGLKTFPPATCPTCQSGDLHYRGFGTKFLEEEIQRSFPDAKIGRIDRDESLKDTLNQTLSAAQSGELNILIGTQMIAKGLDLANVTLVGIVAADDLTSGTDFQSRERAVALMMQAAGRAGRADKPGEVLIQARQLDNPIFDTIQTHDWRKFADDELVARKQFHYPPYRYLARLTFQRRSTAAAEKAASDWMQNHQQPGLELLGPATPSIGKQAGKPLSQVILKTRQRSQLLAAAQDLPRDSTYDIDPISVI